MFLSNGKRMTGVQFYEARVSSNFLYEGVGMYDVDAASKILVLTMLRVDQSAACWPNSLVRLTIDWPEQSRTR